MAKFDRDYNSATRDAQSGLAAVVRGRTSFGELTTVEFTPLIELDSANGLSELRDKQSTSNGGSISADSGEFTLSSGTTANGSAVLETAEKGRYQPGIEAIAGAAVREEALSPNGFWRAGYYDDQNGYWLEKNKDGLHIGHRVGGVDKPLVPEVEWNGERRGKNLDFSETTILRFPHQCYYSGPLRIEAINETNAGQFNTATLHRIGPTAGEPILRQSKLPIRVEVSNGGDTEETKVAVGGRHYGVRGRYIPNRRETDERRLAMSTSTTLTPMISFRKKDNYDDRAKSVKIVGVSIISDMDAIVEVHLNPTGLTNASFGSVSDVPDAETCVESDTSATAITPGYVLERLLVVGGIGERSTLSGIKNLGLDIPDDATITLAIRTVSGTGTASAVFGVEEEW